MEFTEAQSVHNLDDLKDYARRLRVMGLRIAVDDLGSGVASLSHMARLAPDFIKADRSLVEQAHRCRCAMGPGLCLWPPRDRRAGDHDGEPGGLKGIGTTDGRR